MSSSVIIIPSRLAAKRLPGKPLLKINNIEVIIHCMQRAVEAKIGEVIIATPDKEIFDLVQKNSGKAVLTSNDHITGTDRVFEAVTKLSLAQFAAEQFLIWKEIFPCPAHTKPSHVESFPASKISEV